MNRIVCGVLSGSLPCQAAWKARRIRFDWWVMYLSEEAKDYARVAPFGGRPLLSIVVEPRNLVVFPLDGGSGWAWQTAATCAAASSSSWPPMGDNPPVEAAEARPAESDFRVLFRGAPQNV